MRCLQLLTLIGLVFLFSGATGNLSSEITIQKIGPPPGTKKIADNLYYDQNEVSNINYIEFLHWTKRTYGANSDEYNAILPDTNQWSKLNIKYASLDSFYLKKKEFRDYPVLGVSTKQAIQYLNWRSDRVMEFTLVKYGIIKLNPNTSKDAAFRIEKYFRGQYCNIKPSLYLLFYPEYTLLNPNTNTMYGFRSICTYKKWDK